MKKIIYNSLLVISAALLWAGCNKFETNYDGGIPSVFISNFDLRKLYKGSDVTLNATLMKGATSVKGLVTSDHSGKNLPSGLLILQNHRINGALATDSIRGIAINIGADAAKYVPGDSVHVKIDGAVLSRVDGILQVTGVSAANVTKIASGKPVSAPRVPSSFVLNDPARYESTLITIVKGTFNPTLAAGDVLSGDKKLNDGFENITLHTEATATFANVKPPYLGNYAGIVFNKTNANGTTTPQVRMRTAADYVALSSVVEIPSMVFTGFASDVAGGDAPYEYMQFKATRDINFAVTPFSVVTTNNAGATIPTGFPANGWATGQAKTFKFNLTSGTVAKGEFFYVGGSGKLIDGPGSTDISSSKWIRAFNYSTTAGDGFGTATSGLLANSGNAFGMAIFEGTTVTVDTAPIDAIFVGSGGALYDPTPPAKGYRIPNSDLYDKVDPITLIPQPFYRQGSNTINFIYNTADLGYFYKLGGVYDTNLGKWTKARTQSNHLMTKSSSIAELEADTYRVIQDGSGNAIRTDTIRPTLIK